jgi:hypothetical protein
MKRSAFTTLAAAAAALTAQAAFSPANAAVISSNGNSITGLKVGGASYDVTLDGDQSCSQIFAECGASTNNRFAFTTSSEAATAATALESFLLQTTLPGTIGGCKATSFECGFATPYHSNVFISTREFRLDTNVFPNLVRFDAKNKDLVYAVFTPATAVPEPASLALLAAATLGTALVRRKRPR